MTQSHDSERKRHEARQAFLLALGDALRNESDPLQILRVAARMLAEHLGVSCVGFSETNDTLRTVEVLADWTDGVQPSAVGRVPIDMFGEELTRTYQAGQLWIVEDAVTDPRPFVRAAAETYLAQGARAVLGTPLVKDGRWVACLYLTQAEARVWTQDEIALLQDVAERTWAAVERAKAEEALRESEEKYRTLFNSVDEGFSIIELIFDENGRVVDYWHREHNPVFTRMTGIKDAVGKRMSELVPNLEKEWHRTLEKVYYTGEPVRIEYPVQQLDQWYSCYLSRIGDEGSRLIACVYDEITERKRREERQEFIVRLSDAVRRIQDPVEIQNVAMKLIAEKLNVERAGYYEMDDDEDIYTVTARYDRSSIPLPPRGKLSSFDPELLGKYHAGEIVTLNDSEDLQSEPLRAAYRAVAIRSWALVPLVKDGRLLTAIGVQSSVGRNWTRTELQLLEEVAERTWAAVERARAEAALRASEAGFRALSDLVPDLLWSTDPPGETISYNQRWLDYTGQSLEETQGIGWLDAIHPDDREACRAAFAEAFATGQPLEIEHRIRRRDGEHRWFLVRHVPVRDEEGHIKRWFGAATDIHEQHAEREELAEQVSERTAQLRALSQRLLAVQEEERRHLARELHDEVGQELTGIQLLMQQAEKAGSESRDTSLVEVEAQLRKVTEQVRDLSRELRPATLDSFGLLLGLTELGQRVERNTGIRMDLQHEGIERRFSPAVEITAYRIVQEALTNVVRHAGVKVATVLLLAEGGVLSVMIQDAGQGFDAKHTLYIGGLGGMRERAGLLDGTLDVESAPGAGTRVLAELPYDAAYETPPESA